MQQRFVERGDNQSHYARVIRQILLDGKGFTQADAIAFKCC